MRKPSLRSLLLVITALFSVNSVTIAAPVSPIQANYGNVFPGVVNQNLEVFKTNIAGPWYVSFDLLAPADVFIGGYALPVASPFVECCFTMTSMRLTTIEGGNVAFGTNAIPSNPFPGPIDWFVGANNLAAGSYAIEVSGFGNRDSQILGTRVNATDFVTRLTVMSPSAAVPLPAAVWLLGSGFLGLVGIAKRKKA